MKKRKRTLCKVLTNSYVTWKDFLEYVTRNRRKGMAGERGGKKIVHR